jgi:serine/threonine protein kinase
MPPKISSTIEVVLWRPGCTSGHHEKVSVKPGAVERDVRFKAASVDRSFANAALLLTSNDAGADNWLGLGRRAAFSEVKDLLHVTTRRVGKTEPLDAGLGTYCLIADAVCALLLRCTPINTQSAKLMWNDDGPGIVLRVYDAADFVFNPSHVAAVPLKDLESAFKSQFDRKGRRAYSDIAAAAALARLIAAAPENDSHVDAMAHQLVRFSVYLRPEYMQAELLLLAGKSQLRRNRAVAMRLLREVPSRLTDHSHFEVRFSVAKITRDVSMLVELADGWSRDTFKRQKVCCTLVQTVRDPLDARHWFTMLTRAAGESTPFYLAKRFIPAALALARHGERAMTEEPKLESCGLCAGTVHEAPAYLLAGLLWYTYLMTKTIPLLEVRAGRERLVTEAKEQVLFFGAMLRGNRDCDLHRTARIKKAVDAGVSFSVAQRHVLMADADAAEFWVLFEQCSPKSQPDGLDRNGLPEYQRALSLLDRSDVIRCVSKGDCEARIQELSRAVRLPRDGRPVVVRPDPGDSTTWFRKVALPHDARSRAAVDREAAAYHYIAKRVDSRERWFVPLHSFVPNGALQLKPFRDDFGVVPWEKMSTEECMDILIDAADALCSLHDIHIAHLDVSPGNVVLRHKRPVSGERVVTDHHKKASLIDLASAVSDNRTFPAALGTAHGGTPGYAAPEISSVTHFQAGWRADSYSFCCLCWFVLLGYDRIDPRKIVDGVPDCLQCLMIGLSRGPESRPSLNTIYKKLKEGRRAALQQIDAFRKRFSFSVAVQHTDVEPDYIDGLHEWSQRLCDGGTGIILIDGTTDRPFVRFLLDTAAREERTLAKARLLYRCRNEVAFVSAASRETPAHFVRLQDPPHRVIAVVDYDTEHVGDQEGRGREFKHKKPFPWTPELPDDCLFFTEAGYSIENYCIAPTKLREGFKAIVRQGGIANTATFEQALARTSKHPKSPVAALTEFVRLNAPTLIGALSRAWDRHWAQADEGLQALAGLFVRGHTLLQHVASKSARPNAAEFHEGFRILEAEASRGASNSDKIVAECIRDAVIKEAKEFGELCLRRLDVAAWLPPCRPYGALVPRWRCERREHVVVASLCKIAFEKDVRRFLTEEQLLMWQSFDSSGDPAASSGIIVGPIGVLLHEAALLAVYIDENNVPELAV